MTTRVIYGPPGTGKTSTLISMAAEMENPLFLAFTRAAADEINQRLERKVASTLHSYCYRALDMVPAAVVDRRKLAQFSDAVNIQVSGGGQDDNMLVGDEYLAVLSRAMAKKGDWLEAYDEIGRPGNPKQFDYFVRSYLEWKRVNGLFDFDDMLHRFWSDAPHTHHPVVILDEAQDLTPMQWRVFGRIIETSREVVIAGDDDQAIYEWMGADPQGMSKVKGEATELIQSHRVPREAHALAQRVIQQITQRKQKLYQPTDKGGLLAGWNDLGRLITAVGKQPDALWLFRDRYQMFDVQRHLNRAYVPYSIAGGRSPWTSYRAQGVRAWLELRQGREWSECKARLAKAATKSAGPLIEADDHAKVRAMRPDAIIEIPMKQRDFYLDYLTWAALMKPVQLELSTIHRAKGREHNRVIVTLAASTAGLANLYKSRDAEIRTLYVALTRTRDALHLHGTHPLVPMS